MTYIPPRRSDGTLQTRRIQQPWPEDRSFRILSIDGGGICGILPASVLAELEQRFLNGSSVFNHFDMIAGTSTGGIIALGLAHGLTGAQIKKFYFERGGKIFPNPTSIVRYWRKIRRIHRSAYDERVLEQELLEIFNETPLGDAKTRLCIPAYEGVHGEPWIYRTPHHPDYKRDRVERMVKVALATSAAPTYLRAVPNNGYMMVDGGIWANNPVMNAVVDALACYDIRRDQVRILSLGCGETAFTVDARRAAGGLIQWRHALAAAMRAQSHNALGQAGLLIGKENLIRLDMPDSLGPIPMDDHAQAKAKLPGVARTLVEASGHRVQSLFLDTFAVPYQPCHAA